MEWKFSFYAVLGLFLYLGLQPKSSEFSIEMTFHNTEEIFPITFEKLLSPD